MSISTLAGAQNSAMGLIQGTGVAQTQSVNTVMAESQDPSVDQGQSKLSPGAQGMNQLQQLAADNPSQFKAATQKISTDLDAAAKKETDPTKSKFLESLSAKFADASKSGSMSSLQLHGGQHHHGAKSSAAGKYGGQNSQNSGMLSEIGTIVSNALSGFSGASTGSSTSAASIAESGSVLGSESTAT